MWERGQPVPRTILLPCGAKASFDKQSGISHRCTSYFAVVGSIGMPTGCRELMDEHDVTELSV